MDYQKIEQLLTQIADDIGVCGASGGNMKQGIVDSRNASYLEKVAIDTLYSKINDSVGRLWNNLDRVRNEIDKSKGL